MNMIMHVCHGTTLALLVQLGSIFRLASIKVSMIVSVTFALRY